MGAGGTKSSLYSPGLKSMGNTIKHDDDKSPLKMLDEQKKKIFYQKKQEMLKNFETPEKEK